MRLSYYHLLYGTALGLLVLNSSGCSDELHQFGPQGGEGLRLELKASIDQQSDTRADESGFADGDGFGLFVVNYSGNEPGKLTLSDNQVNNVAMTYNADANTWQSATDIYWRDPVTPADVYGYYPFFNGMSDIEAYSFEVKADQGVSGANGDMGSYEASDFLWAKASKATPGKKVELTFSHIMAGVKVVLEQGNGFDGDSWTKLEKTVTVDNTIRTSEIDLSIGVVNPIGNYDRNVVMNPESDAWRAVVVPQTVAPGKSVIGITIDGKSYSYTRSDGMKYAPGKLHTFTIKIDRKADSGDYTLSLVSEDISSWESDQTSHDFDSNSYLTVHVAEAGTLKKCLEALHVDAGSVRNLKVTGLLTDGDFNYIRDFMPLIKSINMKDVSVVSLWYYNDDQLYEKDVLPYGAFLNLSYLQRIILPENLVGIGGVSFAGCNSLNSTIKIPESVKFIGQWAFSDVQGNFSIELPHYLERIEESAFSGTTADVECNLTNSIKYIGYRAFSWMPNLHGVFSLPANLEFLGDEAFAYSGRDLSGSIEIPVKIKSIPKRVFDSMGFTNGTSLKFHDGVT